MPTTAGTVLHFTVSCNLIPPDSLLLCIFCRYYDNWCGGNLEFLDDGKCVKLFPEHIDREWSCGVPTTTVPSEADGYQADTLLANVAIDTTTLNSVVNDTDVNLCIILTKRVADASAPSGVRLYNKYMCAGDYSATTAYETWSRYVHCQGLSQ